MKPDEHSLRDLYQDAGANPEQAKAAAYLDSRSAQLRYWRDIGETAGLIMGKVVAFALVLSVAYLIWKRARRG